MDDLDEFLNGLGSPGTGWNAPSLGAAQSVQKPVGGLGADVGMFELGSLDGLMDDMNPLDDDLLGAGLPGLDMDGFGRQLRPADISPFAPSWPGMNAPVSASSSAYQQAGVQLPTGGTPGLLQHSSYSKGGADISPAGLPNWALTGSASAGPSLQGHPAVQAAQLSAVPHPSLRPRSVIPAHLAPSAVPSSFQVDMGELDLPGDDLGLPEGDGDDENDNDQDDDNDDGDGMDDDMGGAAGASAAGGASSGLGDKDRAGAGSGRAGGGAKVKSSGSSNSLKGLGAEERRAKRLERNRESARQSRRRKKAYLDLLEGRVTALQTQLFELRTSHAASAATSLAELRSRLLATVEPLAYKELAHAQGKGPGLTPEEEATLEDAAAQLVDRFGPDCPERRAVRDFHFDQLQRLLLPPHTKFLLWLVHQPSEFFAPGGPASAGAGEGAQLGHSLWTLLCTEIGLSTDQAERLRMQLRRVVGSPEIPRETWRLGVAALYLQRLRAALETASRKLQHQYEGVKAILTPAQFVRYCAWVDRNRGRLSRAVEQTAVTGPGDGVPVAVGRVPAGGVTITPSAVAGGSG